MRLFPGVIGSGGGASAVLFGTNIAPFVADDITVSVELGAVLSEVSPFVRSDIVADLQDALTGLNVAPFVQDSVSVDFAGLFGLNVAPFVTDTVALDAFAEFTGLNIAPFVTDTVVGAFDPTSLANLEFWFDADDATTITDVAGEVSAWSDKSTQGNDLDQVTVASQPSVDTINGNASLFFDGVDEHIDNTAVTITTVPFTIAVVFTPTTITGSNSEMVSLRDIVPSSVLRLDRDTDDFQLTLGSGGGALVMDVSDILGVGETRWIIARLRTSGVGSSDVLTDQGGSDTGTGPASVAQTTRLSVGGRDNAANDWIGHIHEVIGYEQFLSDPDRALLQNYLNNKWILSGAPAAVFTGTSIGPFVADTVVASSPDTLTGLNIAPFVSDAVIASTPAELSGTSVAPFVADTVVASNSAGLTGTNVAPFVEDTVIADALAELSGTNVSPFVADAVVVEVPASLSGVNVAPFVDDTVIAETEAQLTGTNIAPFVEDTVIASSPAEFSGTSVSPFVEDTVVVVEPSAGITFGTPVVELQEPGIPGGSTVNFTFNSDAGADRVLLGFTAQSDSNASTSADLTATLDGVSATLIRSARGVIDRDVPNTVWFIVAPQAGDTVALTTSAGLLQRATMFAVDVSGIDTADPTGAGTLGAQQTGTSLSQSITTDNDGAVVFGAIAVQGDDTGPFTPSTDFTELADAVTAGGAANGHSYFYERREVATAGAVTVDATWALSDGLTFCYVSLNPA